MKIDTYIRKRAPAQQLILAEVYVPNAIDSQGEYATAATLEAAAHAFAANGYHKNVTIQHVGKNIDAVVVESYIAKKADPDFSEGTWVAVIKVNDPTVWKAVEDGILRGLSIEGTASARKGTVNGKPARERYDLAIHTISLVDKPASKRTFTMTKSQTDLASALTAIAEAIDRSNKQIAKISERQQALDDQLAALPVPGQPVRKARQVHPNAEEITNELRMRDRLYERLWAIGENPSHYPHTSEAEITRAIAKCEDELHALGYQNRNATRIDSNSAFFQRGGTSTFLTGGGCSLASALGIGAQTRDLKKSDEDEISLNCLVL